MILYKTILNAFISYNYKILTMDEKYKLIFVHFYSHPVGNSKGSSSQTIYAVYSYSSIRIAYVYDHHLCVFKFLVTTGFNNIFICKLWNHSCQNVEVWLGVYRSLRIFVQQTVCIRNISYINWWCIHGFRVRYAINYLQTMYIHIFGYEYTPTSILNRN